MSKVIYGMIVLVLIGGAVFFFSSGDDSTQKTNSTSADTQVSSNTNVNKSTNQQASGTDTNSGSVVQTAGKYIDYSQSNYDSNVGSKRVIFFHADWCPTCIIANRDFENNVDEIPAGVTILKTDYDTAKDLKNKYGISYQHTFVLVDDNGDAISKWNGGGLNQLITKVR